MTVYSVTRHKLYCNGGCLRHYEPPADLDHLPRPAELRKLAAKEGWTSARSPLGRKYDRDICPECRPAGDESTEGET
jgi:hypothetical protein